MKINIQPKSLIGRTFRYCAIYTYEIDSINDTEKYYNLIRLSNGELNKMSIKNFEESLFNKSIILL